MRHPLERGRVPVHHVAQLGLVRSRFGERTRSRLAKLTAVDESRPTEHRQARGRGSCVFSRTLGGVRRGVPGLSPIPAIHCIRLQYSFRPPAWPFTPSEMRSLGRRLLRLRVGPARGLGRPFSRCRTGRAPRAGRACGATSARGRRAAHELQPPWIGLYSQESSPGLRPRSRGLGRAREIVAGNLSSEAGSRRDKLAFHFDVELEKREWRDSLSRRNGVESSTQESESEREARTSAIGRSI